MTDSPAEQPALLEVGDPLKEPVSASRLADCLGIDIRSIQDWDKAGHITRTEKGFYVLGDFIRGVYWWQRETINRKKGAEGEEQASLEIREQKAKTEKAEIEVLRLRSELIPVTEVKDQMFSMARRTRDAIENIPARVAAILAAEQDEHKIKEMLTAELSKALEGLSR